MHIDIKYDACKVNIVCADSRGLDYKKKKSRR